MRNIFETNIDAINFDGDELNDREAVFDYSASLQPAEPDVGIFSAYWEFDTVPELLTCMIGIRQFSRSELIEMVTVVEVERIESDIADAIIEMLEDGKLEAAA